MINDMGLGKGEKPTKQKEEHKYKQLPLTGGEHDYCRATDLLDGFDELKHAIRLFYFKNKDVNPRQLHYIIDSESNEEHLTYLLEYKGEKKTSK